jgi:hypothetical protein
MTFVGINDSGRIVGGYSGKSGVIGYGGYVVIAPGGFTRCITNTNVLAGEITREPWRGGQEGFFRFPTGITGYFTIPGTLGGVEGVHVNSKLHKVGYYRELVHNDHFHGFADLGKGFVNIDYPGATRTFCTDINDSDLIVGSWDTGDSTPVHGFVLDHGSFTQIDVPFSGAVFTVVYGVSNDGKMVGTWSDSSFNGQGFALINGAFARITVPNSLVTSPVDINNQGVIVGFTFIKGNSDPFGLVAAPIK